MYTSDHSWVNGCYPNTIAFGLMFNANGIDPFDEQTLFRAMKEAEASQSKAAGNWDCNRFWVCLTGVNYATWGLSALIYALTEGQVLIGTTMGYQPSMFILMEKQLGPGHLKQIKKYYLDAFGGVS